MNIALRHTLLLVLATSLSGYQAAASGQQANADFPLEVMIRLAADQSCVPEIMARVSGLPDVFSRPKNRPCNDALTSLFPDQTLSAFQEGLDRPGNEVFRQELGRRIYEVEGNRRLTGKGTISTKRHLLDIQPGKGSGTIQFLSNGATFTVYPLDKWTGWSPGVQRHLFAPKKKHHRILVTDTEDTSPHSPSPSSSTGTTSFYAQSFIHTHGNRSRNGMDHPPSITEKTVLAMKKELKSIRDDAALERGNVKLDRLRRYFEIFVQLVEWTAKPAQSEVMVSEMRKFLRDNLINVAESVFPIEIRRNSPFMKIFGRYIEAQKSI